MVKRDILLAGIVQGQEEIDAVNRVLNTNPPWHVSGPECSALQKEIAEMIGVKYCVVVNSGSSANLLAMHVLNLSKRSQVLTSACGFPATLNPIIHLDLTPVLVDYSISTLNIDLNQVEQALKKFNVKAMLLAHTLGSSLDMDHLENLKNKYNVELIEDCCEALGTKYGDKCVGTFGKVSTISFYASHQISGFGGGGAILTNDMEIYDQAKSLRDWGKQNVREGYICTQMSTTVEGIPYDQQYTYSTIGYNMRFPDGNCAYAREQIKKLPKFIELRQRNYKYLYHQLQDLPLHFMQYPEQASPAFFGFPIILKKEGLRDKMVEFLESNGVHVRLFFAGNILRHSAYKEIAYRSLDGYGAVPARYRLGTEFPIADYLMKNGFFCGCWPGLTLEDMDYISTVIKEFFNERTDNRR